MFKIKNTHLKNTFGFNQRHKTNMHVSHIFFNPSKQFCSIFYTLLFDVSINLDVSASMLATNVKNFAVPELE